MFTYLLAVSEARVTVMRFENLKASVINIDMPSFASHIRDGHAIPKRIKGGACPRNCFM